jgi:hypothetical protein
VSSFQRANLLKLLKYLLEEHNAAGALLLLSDQSVDKGDETD